MQTTSLSRRSADDSNGYQQLLHSEEESNISPKEHRQHTWRLHLKQLACLCLQTIKGCSRSSNSKSSQVQFFLVGHLASVPLALQYPYRREEILSRHIGHPIRIDIEQET